MASVKYDSNIVIDGINKLKIVESDLDTYSHEVFSATQMIVSARGFEQYIGGISADDFSAKIDSFRNNIISLINTIREKQIEILKISGDKEDISNFFKSLSEEELEKYDLSNLENLSKDAGNIFQRSVATAGAATLGFVEGVGDFLETGADLLVMAGSAVCSIFTTTYDLLTGKNDDDSATKKLWDWCQGYVSKKRVESIFDGFYANTSIGNSIKNNAYHFDTVRSVGKGIGYSTAMIGAVMLTGGLASGVGFGAAGSVTAGQLATTAGILGFSNGTEEAWADGATLVDGFKCGAVTGAWEGIQWYAGAKISQVGGVGDKIAKSVLKGGSKGTITRIALDTADSALEGFVQPAIKLTYKYDDTKSFADNYIQQFEEAGGWQNVKNQAIMGGLMSGAGEVLDARKILKENNNITIDASDVGAAAGVVGAVSANSVLKNVDENIKVDIDNVKTKANVNIGSDISPVVDKVHTEVANIEVSTKSELPMAQTREVSLSKNINPVVEKVYTEVPNIEVSTKPELPMVQTREVSLSKNINPVVEKVHTEVPTVGVSTKSELPMAQTREVSLSKNINPVVEKVHTEVPNVEVNTKSELPMVQTREVSLGKSINPVVDKVHTEVTNVGVGTKSELPMVQTREVSLSKNINPVVDKVQMNIPKVEVNNNINNIIDNRIATSAASISIPKDIATASVGTVGTIGAVVKGLSSNINADMKNIDVKFTNNIDLGVNSKLIDNKISDIKITEMLEKAKNQSEKHITLKDRLESEFTGKKFTDEQIVDYLSDIKESREKRIINADNKLTSRFKGDPNYVSIEEKLGIDSNNGKNNLSLVDVKNKSKLEIEDGITKKLDKAKSQAEKHITVKDRLESEFTGKKFTDEQIVDYLSDIKESREKRIINADNKLTSRFKGDPDYVSIEEKLGIETKNKVQAKANSQLASRFKEDVVPKKVDSTERLKIRKELESQFKEDVIPNKVDSESQTKIRSELESQFKEDIVANKIDSDVKSKEMINESNDIVGAKKDVPYSKDEIEKILGIKLDDTNYKSASLESETTNIFKSNSTNSYVDVKARQIEIDNIFKSDDVIGRYSNYDIDSRNLVNGVIHANSFGFTEKFHNNLLEIDDSDFYKFIGSDYGKYFLSLSKEEIASCLSYSGLEFRSINTELRLHNVSDYINNRVKSIDSAIAKYGGLKEDTILYRGLDFSRYYDNTTILGKLMSTINPEDVEQVYSVFESLKGKSLIEEGFLSTSSTTSGTMSGNIQMEIKTPKGTAGLDLSIMSPSINESEFLMARDTSLLIDNVSIRDGKDGKYVLVECTASNNFDYDIKNNDNLFIDNVVTDLNSYIDDYKKKFNSYYDQEVDSYNAYLRRKELNQLHEYESDNQELISYDEFIKGIRYYDDYKTACDRLDLLKRLKEVMVNE